MVRINFIKLNILTLYMHNMHGMIWLPFQLNSVWSITAQTDGPNMENSPSIQRDSSQLSPWIVSTRVTPTAVRPGLSMYVWTLGWDASVPGCDKTKFLSFDKLADPQCFTHNWDTQQKRYYLWNTVTRQGMQAYNSYPLWRLERVALIENLVPKDQRSMSLLTKWVYIWEGFYAPHSH